MAYLNVRERRLETRIAYVGAPGTGKSTNLEQLGRRASPQPSTTQRSVTDDVGEVVALDWSAGTDDRFRDCDVFARIVAPRGSISVDRARALLRDVDGVVIVVDATPDATDTNRATAELVREALAAASREKVPVVVQVNKRDAVDAREADVVVAELGAAWPHVEAAAANGVGVVETLERALADVLHSLQSGASDSDTATRAPSAVTRTEGNPLLTALRQVMRDTVAEHVAELEARFLAKLETQLGATPAGSDAEIAALRKTLIDESVRTRGAIDSLRATLNTSVTETTRALASHSGAIAGLERKLLDESEVLGKVETLQAKVDKLREEVRSEVVRVVEVQARADREHVATIAANLRRVVEQVSADVKQAQTDARDARQKDDTRARLATIGEALQRLERALGDDVRDVVVAHVIEVADLARSSSEGVTEVRARMTELVEELKKREKKGWFG